MRLKPAMFRQDLETLFDLLRQKKIRPLIAHRFPPAEARHAHELLAKGGVTGKIVLVTGGSGPWPDAIRGAGLATRPGTASRIPRFQTQARRRSPPSAAMPGRDSCSRRPCQGQVKRGNSMANYILIRHRVKNFDEWKRGYDAHLPKRTEAGLKEMHLLRGSENPNEVVMLFQAADVGRAKAFAESADLKEAMQKAGVIDRPDVHVLKG